MELYCRNCGNLIPEKDRNEATTIAICPECGTVFDFNDELRVWQASQQRHTPPKGIHVTTHADGSLSLHFHWLNWRAPLFSTAGIFVTGTPAGLLSIVGGGIGSIPALFLLPLVGVFLFGLWLLYYSLTLFTNKTRISINVDQVTVKHGPLPLRRTRQAHPDDLKRVVAEAVRFADGTAEVYAVQAVRREDGARVDLLTDLRNEAWANFIALQIDSFITSSAANTTRRRIAH